MALFTDGTIAKLDDLRAYESAVLDLASGEGIDVGAKLKTAQREIATELIPFITKSGAGSRDLSQVVVTDALLQAHALRTLALIYRDLYQSRLNDRYEGKWREYVRESDRAMRNLFDAGVGLSLAPIMKAAAPAVSSVGGGLLPARTYYVRIAWTAGSGATGAPSDAMAISLTPATKLRVTPPAMPGGVIAWCLYAGTAPGVERLQAATLSASAAWTEPDSGLRTDLASLPVQTPDYFVENKRTILRG